MLMRPNLPMAMAITCMLRHAVTTSCYENPANGSTSYFKTLTPVYYPPNGDCSDFYVPISIDYEQPEFNPKFKWTDSFGLQSFMAALTARASAPVPEQAPFVNAKQFKGDYEIAASFCTPRKPNGNEKKVIVATHGIGPGRTHWNSPFKPEEFNFVQYALSKGYSVFFYDRLGCGASSKADGFELSLETAKAVLKTLVKSVKEGKYTGKIKAEKVALLSFSFGSFTTHKAISEEPDLADAIILTGFSNNITGINGNGLLRSFVPRIANIENSARFGDRDDGYLAWPSVFDLIMNYFKAPAFAPSTALFTQSAIETFTLSELLTFAAPANISAEKWDKPALHLTGELDYIVCDGQCKGIIETPAKEMYPNAKPLQVSIQPAASHHLNFATNATGAYGVITDFLDANLK